MPGVYAPRAFGSKSLAALAVALNALLVLSLLAVFCVLYFGKPERAFLAPEFLRFTALFASASALGVSLTATGGKAARMAGYAVMLAGCAFFAFMAAFALYCYHIRSLELARDMAVLGQAGFGQALWYVKRFVLSGDGAALFAGVLAVSAASVLLAALCLCSRLAGVKADPARFAKPVRQIGRARLAVPVICLTLLAVSAYAASGGIVAGALRAGHAQAEAEHAAMIGFYDALRDVKSVRGKDGVARVPAAPGLHVVIIDSSVNANFMSAWGAPIATTPRLDGVAGNSGVTLFKSAFATSRVGGDSLLWAMSERIGPDYGGEAAGPHTVEETIVDAAMRSGMDVIWLSNVIDPSGNFTLAGAQGDVTAEPDATGATGSVFTVKGLKPERRWPERDEVLLPALDEAIGGLNPQKGGLLVLHLAGRKAPASSLYGKLPEVPEHAGWIGKLAKNPPLLTAYRDYMAGLAYTDDVIEQIMRRVAQVRGMPVSVFYFSDRADVFHARYAGGEFAWPLLEVPAWVWLSGEYRARYPDRAEALAENAGRMFPTYAAFDLLVGLTGVESPFYDAGRDIATRDYGIGPSSVLAGGYRLEDSPAARLNTHLNDVDLAHLGVHACNTVLKTEQALRAGIRRVEVDLIYIPKTGLAVGHDEKHSTTLTFAEYLRLFADRLDFIWLDVKNISADTNRQILAELESLDARYSLRGRALVESKNSGALRLFAENGWETSWYLRWKDIERAIEDGRAEEFAAGLAASLELNSISGLSYALTADQNVQTRLKPALPEGTASYCWEPGLVLHHVELKEKTAPYGHLRCLLVEMPTAFELF